jgi:hypothetical protein
LNAGQTLYYVDDGEKIIEKAKKFYFNNKRGISDKSKFFEDIVKLERDIDEKNYFSPMDFEKVLLEHPCFLGYIALGDDIFNYKKFNFSSLKSLSESITSFCIGERSFSDEYIWRLNDFKNVIHQNMHGDLYASQYKVFGKSSLEENLFGEEEENLDISAKVLGSGVGAYQDWSQFLVASLKYAEYLGKEKMSEIVNWEDVLEKAGGGVGTATSEAEFGSGFSDYNLKFLLEHPVLEEGKKIEQFPLSIHSFRDSSFYPYFSNGKLFYLREDDDGGILMETLSKVFGNKKFSKVLEYSENDLPHLLTGTYKYFARDRSIMYKIMNRFNESHK